MCLDLTKRLEQMQYFGVLAVTGTWEWHKQAKLSTNLVGKFHMTEVV